MSKPDDVSQKDWDKASDLITTVTNNHHCWGIFEGAPDGYTNELHVAVSRLLMEEREQIVSLIDTDEIAGVYIAPGGVEAISKAIRNGGK